jgi:hypothetical protein
LIVFATPRAELVTYSCRAKNWPEIKRRTKNNTLELSPAEIILM